MSRLDRYLFRETAIPFALAILLAVLLVFLFQAQRLLGAALGLGMTASDLLLIFVAALPPFLVLAIPLAVLLAVMIGLGRMSMDRELMVLGAAGASPLRLGRAPLVLGILVSLAALPIAHFAEPIGVSLLYARLVDVAVRNASQAIRPGTFNEDFAGLALYAEARDPSGGLRSIMLYDERDAAHPILILAASGRLSPRDRQTLVLELEGGEMHLGAPVGEDRYDRLRFDRARLGIDAEREIVERTRFLSEISMMRSSEMLAEAKARDSADTFGRRIEKAFWRRFSLPLMAAVFALLGVGVTLFFGPRARSKSALFALGTVVLYYLLTRLGDYAVVKLQHAALWAALLPNAAIFALALGLLGRAGRPR